MSVAVGSSTVTEENGNLMQCFWGEAEEIEAHVGILGIVRGVTLLTVNKIRELNGIFDEENGRVVSDHVVVSLFSVVLDGETTRVTITVI
jgi:hypothetical protein